MLQHPIFLLGTILFCQMILSLLGLLLRINKQYNIVCLCKNNVYFVNIGNKSYLYKILINIIMIKIAFCLIFTSFMLGLISCSQEVLNDEVNLLPDEICCKNDLLVLSDEAQLREILSCKSVVPENLNFVSLQDVFNEIVDKEYVYGMSLECLSEERLNEIDLHCAFYRKMLQKEVIKEVKYSDGTELYQLNLCFPNYAKVLNEDGFFAIKDTIFQVTPEKFKVWKGGNINDYLSLSRVEKTDESRGIYVYESEPKVVTKSLFPLHSIDQKVAFAGNYNPKCTNLDEDIESRIVLTFYDITKLKLPGYTRETYIRVSNQKQISKLFRFVETSFYMWAWFYTYVEGVEQEPMEFYVEGTASDVWYTIYFPYQFLEEGKTIQSATDKYWNIKRYRIKGSNNLQGIGVFEGKRDTPTSGIFYYTGFDFSCVRLNQLLPE